MKRRRFFANKLCELIPDLILVPKQDRDDYILISSNISAENIAQYRGEDESEGELKIPSYNNNEMLHIVHVALYLHKLSLDHKRNKTATLNEETAFAAVPEDLYMFMALYYAGSDALDYDDTIQDEIDEDDDPKAAKIRLMTFDSCQDLVFSVTGGKNIPPKQYSLGLTISNLSRTKLLLNLLHKAKQIIPPHQINAADNALAKEVLKGLDEETGAVVPSNLVHGRPTQYWNDNMDCAKESQIAGHSAGWHGDQFTAFQPGPSVPIDVSQICFDYKTVEVPDAVHRRLDIDRPIKKDPPWLLTREDVDSILNTGDSPAYNSSQANNMAFLMYRQNTDRSKDRLSDWTEFNKHLCTNQTKPASIVGQMPLLNAKADQHETIYTIGERTKHLSQVLGQEHSWQTIDQAIHAPSQEVKWTFYEEWKKIHLRLGGLHTALTHMGTAGNHVAGSELVDIWIQSGIITEGALDKILRGKDYKGGMKLHKKNISSPVENLNASADDTS